MEDNNTTPLLPSKGLDIAFHGMGTCTDTDLVIPDSVTTIYDCAFLGAKINSLFIPKSVTTIFYDSLLGCKQLETIEIAKDNPVYHSANNCIIETATKTLITGIANSIIPADGSVEHIGVGAFNFCYNLYTIDIPFGVKSIDNSAFKLSGLRHISIPNSVKKIGWTAFYSPSLQSIKFNGTKEQWYAIEKDKEWRYDCRDYELKVYCTNTTLTYKHKTDD